jgi:hypothetical protein
MPLGSWRSSSISSLVNSALGRFGRRALEMATMRLPRDDLISAVRYAFMMRRSGKVLDECKSYGKAPGAHDPATYDPRSPRGPTAAANSASPGHAAKPAV